jgi:hypothetical protein
LLSIFNLRCYNKAVRNPVHTAVHPAKYTLTGGAGEADSALGQAGELRDYLARLAAAVTVTGFVASQPWAGATAQP